MSSDCGLIAKLGECSNKRRNARRSFSTNLESQLDGCWYSSKPKIGRLSVEMHGWEAVVDGQCEWIRDPNFSSDAAWHSDSVPCILFHKIFIRQALRI
jgi:hypothetical protein